MRKWQQLAGLAAGLGLVTAVLAMTSPASALAQGALKPLAALIVNDASQPVPVRNVGPVRTPFSHDDVGECNASNCFFDFPVVPEGRRLVILHASGMARPDSTTTIFDQAQLVTDNTENEFGARHVFAMTRIGQQGSNVLADTWAFNGAVLAFVEAGHQARLTMTTRDGGTTFFSQATLSGYWEDVE